jgi:pimeloyl-ACP methyl ester carboxylesterase
MRELAVPTLVLFGTEDRITPPELGRRYVELLPNGHLMLVYDAAHAIDGDRPEAFAAIAEDFLERHEQFVVRRESGVLYP